jgi:hypothetical protein
MIRQCLCYRPIAFFHLNLTRHLLTFAKHLEPRIWHLGLTRSSPNDTIAHQMAAANSSIAYDVTGGETIAKQQ